MLQNSERRKAKRNFRPKATSIFGVNSERASVYHDGNGQGGSLIKMQSNAVVDPSATQNLAIGSLGTQDSIDSIERQPYQTERGSI